jgi:hypothetical protein
VGGWNSGHGGLGCENLFNLEKDEIADSCLFCGMQDSSFLESDNLDIHFCQKCPMLVSCNSCRQIVEISSYKDHLLYECSGKRQEGS